jgi:hypothetical protein
MVILVKVNPAFPEALYPDLRTLQVCKHANLVAMSSRPVADLAGTLDMVIVYTVREINPDDIHTSLNHVIKDILAIRCRTKSCNNFGASGHYQGLPGLFL